MLPGGSMTPGFMRIPWSRTLPSPIAQRAPSTERPRTMASCSTRAPGPMIEPRTNGSREDVLGSGEVTPRCAYVPPIGTRDVGPQAPLGLEVRENLTLDGNLSARGNHGQNLRLEHVNTGVYQIRRHLVGGGLLEESVHQHLMIHLDESVSRRVLDARQHDRRQGVRLFVLLDR